MGNIKICSIDNCNVPARARGWCEKHYRRWYVHGDTNTKLANASGEGGLSKGYRYISQNGVRRFEHIIIAEEALGRTLKKGECVHHVDGNKLNNKKNNLLICPSFTYHMALHARQRAYDESGNANWRKCTYCKQYDDPKNLYISCNRVQHVECSRKYQRNRYLKKKRNKHG